MGTSASSCRPAAHAATHVLTGDSDRAANMERFATAALELLAGQLAVS